MQVLRKKTLRKLLLEVYSIKALKITKCFLFSSILQSAIGWSFGEIFICLDQLRQNKSVKVTEN